MLANRIRKTATASSALVTTAYTLTSSGVSNAGGGTTEDRKFFGYGHDRFGVLIAGASLNSYAFGGYTIKEMQEITVYDTDNGSYGTLTTRIIYLELGGGPGPLAKASITSLNCPGGQSLASSASGFAATADGGQWNWAGTTNPGNETTADYLPSGTVTIVV